MYIIALKHNYIDINYVENIVDKVIHLTSVAVDLGLYSNEGIRSGTMIQDTINLELKNNINTGKAKYAQKEINYIL